MQVSDITIEVRSLALGRLGQIDMRLVSDMKIVKRFMNVGAWELSLPAEDNMAKALAQKGRGITVEGPMFTLASGRVLNWTLEQTTTDSLGNLKFIGVDDMVHLADALAWPQPSNGNVETQNVGHDVRSGLAETVIKAYVNANIGPGAPIARRIPELVIAPDLNRGSMVTGRARFDKLGVLLSQLGAAGIGNLGFDIMQVDDQLIFDVFQPLDKSDTVRMDIANDTLDNVMYGVSAPAVTRAIIAGQGEMEDRRIVQYSDGLAATAENEWGRKIEEFFDRRDTESDDELYQTGIEAVTAGGRTLYALSVKPADDQTMVYGVDWYLGDIVSVTVDDQPISAIVTEAIISITADGVRVGATVGDAVGFDYEAKMIAAQKDQEKRLAFLEKNAEASSDIAWADVTGKPTTFAPSAHSHAAADITSGTLADARIPNLNASKTTAGTFAAARLPAATETAIGAVERLTQAEVNTGTDTTRYASVATLRAATWLPRRTQTGTISGTASGYTTVTLSGFSATPKIVASGGTQSNVGVPRIVSATSTSFQVGVWTIGGAQTAFSGVDWIAMEI